MKVVNTLIEGPRPQLILAVASAAGLVVLTSFWFRNKKKSRPPPMITEVGLLGTIKAITGGGMREFLIDQFYKMGDIFRLPFPFPMVVVVVNNQDSRAIYKDPLTIKPAAMYSAIDAFSSGPSITSIAGKPGDSWYHRRKAMNSAFASKLVKRMNEVALEKAQKWINQTLLPRHGGSFNVGTEMVLLTISVISKAAFEHDMSEAESKEILQAIKLGVEEFTIKTMVSPLRKIGTWFLPDRRRAFQETLKLKKFAIQMMDKYRRNPNPTQDTVIDVIMKNPNYEDDSERIPDIIMMLFAGHDTTGYTLAFALRELALNPKEQQKLRQEIQQNDGGAYVKAVLNETMRLTPASPLGAIKQLGRDFTTKDGYTIPNGSIIFIGLCALLRDASIFPDPSEFQPARWLQDRVTPGAKQALFPFSLGKRNCVGQPLANAELQSVLPLLIRHFEFTIEEKGQIVTQGTMRLDDCLLKATKIAV